MTKIRFEQRDVVQFSKLRIGDWFYLDGDLKGDCEYLCMKTSEDKDRNHIYWDGDCAEDDTIDVNRFVFHPIEVVISVRGGRGRRDI